MKKTLLIIAAGMGSRYGGLKQIAPVGPNGEIIIEYSMYDAIRAGFDKVVFVIRRHFEQAFREQIGRAFEDRMETAYAYQELDTCLKGYPLPDDRQKPWGTAHAILAAHAAIDEPFAVINADDYYGVDSFRIMADRLSKMRGSEKGTYAMVGYLLGNTLSAHGTVARGLCEHDADMYLTAIHECTDIRQVGSDAVYTDAAGREQYLPGDAVVSMNLWGFEADIFGSIQSQFDTYLKRHGRENKSEFGIPTVVDELIQSKQKKVKILKTHESWFGITYRQDQSLAQAGIRRLIDAGVYPENLYSKNSQCI